MNLNSPVETSAPSTGTNNSTSISPMSSSANPDVQSSSIPIAPSSTAASVSSSVKGDLGQMITPAGNHKIDSGNDLPVTKPERITSSRTTNGSDSRAGTDGHRTPNVENLSKTNLYICGLAANTTDETLYNLCSQFGNITSTKAILDKITGDCKGYGFVQFINPRSAEVAVQELNKSGVQAQMARISTLYSSHSHTNQHHNFHHNHFHPNHQNNGNSHHHHHHHHHHPNGGGNHGNSSNHRCHNNVHSHSQNTNHHNSSDPDPTNLYIANLPTNMSEQELEMLLSQYGPVVSTRILRDLDNRSKGVGFARMESRDKCQEIIDNLNGKPYKGSNETLLVKFADGGVKKRHQHSSHHHNNHYSHHHQQHHKLHPDEGRWRDTGNTSRDSSNISSFDQQSNIPHGNQMTDLSMMSTIGYHRLPPTFPPTMAPGAAYPTPLGPSTSGPQWIHPSGPAQPWNLIPQHMIPTSGLAPSNQAAAAAAMFHSQLASQMQGLQISHHPGAPIQEGYLPQWPAMWPHPVQPQQPNQQPSMRLAGPLPHLTSAQQPPHDQLSPAATVSTPAVSTMASSIHQQELSSDPKQPGVASEKKLQVSPSL